MPIITESDFAAQIKSGNFKNAYFIYGEEKYLVDHFTRQLTDKILQSKCNNSFNLQNFSSPELDIDALNSAVEALPLMAPFKCVRIFDLNLDKEPLDTVKKLKGIIADIPETTVLIISFPNLNLDLKRSSRYSSFIKLFEKHGDVLNLQALSKTKLQRQIIKWAEKLSCTLSEKNAQLIIDKCGNNLLVLKNEIEKLCAYANRSEITSQIIDEVAVCNFEANVFELTKAIMAKNCDRAFEILDILLFKKEEPIAILSVMASSYIDMYRVNAALQSGKNIQAVAEIFDYKRKMFRLENAQTQLKYDVNLKKSLRGYIDLITKTDVMLKSSRMDPKILLEKLIVKLVIC